MSESEEDLVEKPTTTEASGQTNEGVPELPTPSATKRGWCLKCRQRVELEDAFTVAATRYHRGPESKKGPAPPCGPVIEAFYYHVFFWGPTGPERDVMRTNAPLDAGVDLAQQILGAWETVIAGGFTFTDPKSGAAILGQEKPVRIRIQSWALLGVA